jgi:Mg/Co/Ni transporter MgtE
MQADDAADAIADLPQARRLAIMELLSEDHRRKVLSLLSFNAETAGGLMMPDCISVPATSTVTEAMKAVKETRNVEGIAATTTFLVDKEGRLTGAIPVASLVRTDLDDCIAGFAEASPAHVHPDTDLVELALVMSDYNLAVLPVTDTEHRIVGVVTVDDVLEATVPAGWRRRGPGSHAVSEPSASSEE